MAETPLGDFVATFNAGIGAEWSPSSGQVVADAGGVRVNHTAASEYNDLNANSTYNLTDSHGYVQLRDAGNQGLTSHEVIYLLDRNYEGSDQLMFYVTGGNLFAYNLVGGSQSSVGSSAPYNSTAHQWLQIRESGGQTFWETSANGVDWDAFASVANPFAVTDMVPIFRCGNWQDEASASSALFDNFNTAGPAPYTVRGAGGVIYQAWIKTAGGLVAATVPL